jgi:hypothetical protein
MLHSEPTIYVLIGVIRFYFTLYAYEFSWNEPARADFQRIRNSLEMPPCRFRNASISEMQIQPADHRCQNYMTDKRKEYRDEGARTRGSS